MEKENKNNSWKKVLLVAAALFVGLFICITLFGMANIETIPSRAGTGYP